MKTLISAASAAGVAVTLVAAAHAAPTAKPAAKPAGKPGAALSASAVIARLKQDEAAVKTARITLLTTQRAADLPENTKGAAGARSAVEKSPLIAQKREYLVFSGADWKRDITVTDAQGNVDAHFLLGAKDKVDRVLQETGHADSAQRQASVGGSIDQNAADRMLFHRASDVLQGVTWRSVKSAPGQLILTGARIGEELTVTLRTSPAYAVQKILATESVVTPQGAATRGQELTATYEPGKTALKSLDHLLFLTGALNRAALTQYKVEGLQTNQPIGAAELALSIPAGTRVTDSRFDPPVRYTQGDKDLTMAELKALYAKAATTATAKVGSAAPDWELKSLDGKQVKLSGMRGKVVLLTWFASWCPPCNAEAPVMEKEIWQKLKDQGLQVIGVDASEREDPEKMAREFVAKHGVTYPVVLDDADEASNAYEIQVLPTIALIDRKGTLRYLARGFDHEAVSAQLEKLLAEK